MNFSRFQEPNYKAAKIAPCEYWFEDVRPQPGIAFEGCAYIEVDGADWYIHEIRLGDWRKGKYGPEFVSKGLLCKFWNSGHGVPSHDYFQLLEKYLAENYGSEIGAECIKAGEAE